VYLLFKKNVYDVMKQIYSERYSIDNHVKLQFSKFLGNQAPTEKVHESDAMDLL
jgi:hypothetical protein